MRSFADINEKYELEIERVVKMIEKEKAIIVLLQFPDALKPYSTAIAEEIEKQAKCICLIWLSTCFGACDIPQVEHIKPKIDLIVQFGHSAWGYKNENLKEL